MINDEQVNLISNSNCESITNPSDILMDFKDGIKTVYSLMSWKYHGFVICVMVTKVRSNMARHRSERDEMPTAIPNAQINELMTEIITGNIHQIATDGQSRASSIQNANLPVHGVLAILK